MSNVLVIDTATADCGIALIGGGFCYFLPLDPQKASESIIAVIDEVIKKAGIHPADLKGLVAVKGPGSFTGLRVGLSVANTFAHELKIPLVGITTDEYYAGKTDEKDFIFLQSMNRDEVYAAGFGKCEFEPHILLVEDLLSQYPNFKWIGQLRPQHQERLSDQSEIARQKSIEETWSNLIKNTSFNPLRKYQLIEPFYGKAPHITPGKSS